MKHKNVERKEFIFLKSLIREKKTTYSEMAEVLGISTSTFSKKINGYIQFRLSDMCNILVYLNIGPSEINRYFFDGTVKRTMFTRTA